MIIILAIIIQGYWKESLIINQIKLVNCDNLSKIKVFKFLIE